MTESAEPVEVKKKKRLQKRSVKKKIELTPLQQLQQLVEPKKARQQTQKPRVVEISRDAYGNRKYPSKGRNRNRKSGGSECSSSQSNNCTVVHTAADGTCSYIYTCFMDFLFFNYCIYIYIF